MKNYTIAIIIIISFILGMFSQNYRQQRTEKEQPLIGLMSTTTSQIPTKEEEYKNKCTIAICEKTIYSEWKWSECKEKGGTVKMLPPLESTFWSFGITEEEFSNYIKQIRYKCIIPEKEIKI